MRGGAAKRIRPSPQRARSAGYNSNCEQNELLRGAALAQLPVIEEAFVLIKDSIIAEYGAMYELELKVPQLPKPIIDAQDQFVLPTWCDSHTHIVFAKTREEEFIDKIKGMSYAEIAAKGGGILNSAAKLNAASEDELFNSAWQRLEEITKRLVPALLK